MKILFGTDVVLDLMLDRRPHATSAIKLVSAVENKLLQGYLCATTMTKIDCLITKSAGKYASRLAIDNLLEIFQIAEVNHDVLKSAMELDYTDFEDAVLFQSGIQSQMNGLVTHRIDDFKFATLPIYTPEQLQEMVDSHLKDAVLGISE